MRNGGACYTRVRSPDHSLDGAVTDGQRSWGRLGDTGVFGGGTQDLKHHCCMLLVLAEELCTANSHSLLPHRQEVFLRVLHAKKKR